MTGAAGDGGGLHVRVAVSDGTPICRRLRACGLHGGYGLVALEPVAMGAPVVEYVGEILSREQASAREEHYAEQQLPCSYSLFAEVRRHAPAATRLPPRACRLPPAAARRTPLPRAAALLPTAPTTAPKDPCTTPRRSPRALRATQVFVIDPTLYGNVARFMNASCEPSVRPTPLLLRAKLSSNAPGLANAPRVLFVATRDIAAGRRHHPLAPAAPLRRAARPCAARRSRP